MIPVYFAEANGPRIFQYGVGTTDVGQDFQPYLATWDLTPFGRLRTERATFRAIQCEVFATNGFIIGITPIVDSVPLPLQQFQGVGTGEALIEAPLFISGTRIAAHLTILSRLGDVDVRNLRAAVVPQRQWPQAP